MDLQGESWTCNGGLTCAVVHRLDKEHTLYKREAEDQQKKLDKFLAEGAEDWDVGNAVLFRPLFLFWVLPN